MASRQVLAYTFGSESRFEGQLVGALERIESGGAMRVIDALFVAREPETGQLTAVVLSGGSGGILSQLLDFRLNPGKRTTVTEQALAGPARDTIESLAATLAPGAAFAAVLVEHVWAATLGDAVARIGGGEAANAFVDVAGLGDASELLLNAAARGS
jgi:hypothetical protein